MTEQDLVPWAAKVSAARIRERAMEEEVKPRPPQPQRWFDHGYTVDGASIVFDICLPAVEGEAVVKAVDELASRIVDDDSAHHERQASALAALVTSGGDASGATTLVLHAPLERLAGDKGGFTFGGSFMSPETVRKLACDSRLQVVLEHKGAPVAIGTESRFPNKGLRRQVLYRDGNTCSFPGCSMKRFLKVHHIEHWARDRGETVVTNLITVCTFHHDLVHERGWSVIFDSRGSPMWFRPGGRRYEPGRAPPDKPLTPPEQMPGALARMAKRYPIMAAWQAIRGPRFAAS